MKHLNGNLLCVVDTETLGTDPTKHDLVEVAAIILNSITLEPVNDIMPFHMILKPENLKAADAEAISLLGMDHDVIEKDKVNRPRHDVLDKFINGHDKYAAAELFVNWFQAFNLPFRKKLIPIAHNWPFDKAFLVRWLGLETFEMIFSPLYRCTLQMSLHENDLAGYRGYEFPFVKNQLGYLCRILHIEHNKAHTALGDAYATSQLYKKLIQMSFPRPVQQ